MSSEEITEEEPEASEGEESADSREVRERLGAGRERAVEGFDEGVIDLLSWVLDTETRAKIYIHLRKHPDSTSDEVAEGTGLYPSTVREALAELHEEGTVERGKRESDGAGNNPYEYRAIPPSALVRGAIGEVQDSLNAVFQLDRYVGGEETSDEEPVTITVDDAEGSGDEMEADDRMEADDETGADEMGTDEWGETGEDRAMADETDAEPDASALSKAGDGGESESDEDAEATKEDDVDRSDATVDEDLADQDEEAVEEGEAAEAKAEGGTEGESQEAAGDGEEDEEDQDEDIEESL